MPAEFPAIHWSGAGWPGCAQPPAGLAPLLVAEGLVVHTHCLLVLDDDPRTLPIHATTRALIDEQRGPLPMLALGWLLSLGGAALAWQLHAAAWGLGLGVALMLAGSWVVHSYHTRCLTRLLIADGASVQVVADRVRSLGDDGDALLAAQRAVMRAATLQQEALSRAEARRSARPARSPEAGAAGSSPTRAATRPAPLAAAPAADTLLATS